MKPLHIWNVYGDWDGMVAYLAGEPQPRGIKLLGSVTARTEAEAITRIWEWMKHREEAE